MSAIKILAVALMLAGALGLAYGGFSYTQETHHATLGPLDLSVQDRKTVNVPLWVSVAAIVVGGALLIRGDRKR
jgi:TRAP-type C4-dicarboxylate transport system permease small subunit